ncbi:hypothetical protein AN401_07275 [Zobellella denitrificans]|uniref:Uncharacterized protein n=1 Tax=Zobellella denitrificans TaxID=347534 RepID=A0A291HNG9_9GAMM|nr:hypothetical protein [Zobellella denitrificans]ATG73684.1 hypothetical protein AN401_07275 [Zobellella denitrificans]
MSLPPGIAAILPFRPNWRRPVEQGREYLTDILDSRDRTEQRRALRSKPRATLQYTISLDRDDALAAQQLLATLQPRPLLAPLWPRITRTTATAGSGATVLTLDRPFPPDTRVGDHLVLMNPGTEPEAATISALSGDRKTITLSQGLAAAWPAGCEVYPAWQVSILQSVSARRYTSAVLEAVLRLDRRVDALPPAAPYGAPEAEVDGIEVLLRRVNWAANVSTPFDWRPLVVDGTAGPFATLVDGRFSPLALSGEVACGSRDEVDWWLGFFDRLRGRQGQFLTASHVDPLPLQPPTVGGIDFEVAGTALGRWAPYPSVVTHLQVRKPDGTIGHYRIYTITPDFGAGVTRITTIDPWDESYGPWEALSTWLVCNARLVADSITLRWHTTEVATFSLALAAVDTTLPPIAMISSVCIEVLANAPEEEA